MYVCMHTYLPNTGAPLIAMVACLGLAVDVTTNAKTTADLDAMDANDADAIIAYVHKKMDYLATSRPTAVNLFNALKEVKTVLDQAKAGDNDSTARARICQAIVNHAEFMVKRDVSDNETIGRHGAAAVLSHIPDDQSATMVTICNTGSLATAGYGTALGVARALSTH